MFFLFWFGFFCFFFIFFSFAADFLRVLIRFQTLSYISPTYFNMKDVLKTLISILQFAAIALAMVNNKTHQYFRGMHVEKRAALILLFQKKIKINKLNC